MIALCVRTHQGVYARTKNLHIFVLIDSEANEMKRNDEKLDWTETKFVDIPVCNNAWCVMCMY